MKSLCHQCGHSYLAEPNETGGTQCPRCRSYVAPSGPYGDSPAPVLDAQEESYSGPSRPEDPAPRVAARFSPLTPPPSYVRGERLIRGVVFGSLAAGAFGAVFGAGTAAIQLTLPVLAGIIVGIVTGIACRYGFGGRSVPSTRGRAGAAAAVCATCGILATLAGGWAVERWTNERSAATREDLAAGLRGLARERAHTQDAEKRFALDRRIREVHRLQSLSDAEIEDYLWTQQAQLDQPLLAYAWHRIRDGAMVHLGPEGKTVRLGLLATAGAWLLDLVLAAFLAARGVMPPRRAAGRVRL
ncbi:MAG: hypothetical protein ACE5JG_11645 [Planctomycetota bacterium]